MDVGWYPSGVSPYGAHDTAGNVLEWVTDWYGKRYYAGAPERNPKGPPGGQFRVLRGGSRFNPPWKLRSSPRNYFDPSDRYNNIGFRCSQ